MTLMRLQNLKPGMLISEDAQTHLGKLVIPRGTRLNQDNIQTLKAWGIPEVNILDQNSVKADGAISATSHPEFNEEAETAIKILFTKSNTDHPAIQELMRLAVQSRLP